VSFPAGEMVLRVIPQTGLDEVVLAGATYTARLRPGGCYVLSVDQQGWAMRSEPAADRYVFGSVRWNVTGSPGDYLDDNAAPWVEGVWQDRLMSVMAMWSPQRVQLRTAEDPEQVVCEHRHLFLHRDRLELTCDPAVGRTTAIVVGD